MPYPYPGLFAIDPSNPSSVASNAELTLFDPSDSARSPIALFDTGGLVLTNPVMTNDKGFVGAFQVHLPEVGWESAGLVGYVQSFRGIKSDAEAAALSATSSADDAASALAEAVLARQAAEDAANMIDIPADAAVAQLLGQEGSDTQGAADARYTKRGELVVNARDHGVRGDGTDETARFQAALDAAAELGANEVFVPQSTMATPYLFGRLLARGSIIFRSAPGVKYSRKGLSFGIGNITGVTEPLSNVNDPYSASTDIKIVGGTWDGNPVSEPYLRTGFVVFWFAMMRNLEFEDVTVKDVVTNHAIDINGVEGLHLTRCRFLGYLDATIPGDASYPRNYSEAVQLGPFSDDAVPHREFANGSPTRRVRIRDCYFGASGTPGTQAWPCGVGNHSAIWTENVSDVRINDNTFDRCTYAGIRIYGWDETYAFNNTFKGCYENVKVENFCKPQKWDAATKSWLVAPVRREMKGIHIDDNDYVDTVFRGMGVSGSASTTDPADFAFIKNGSIKGNKIYGTPPSERSFSLSFLDNMDIQNNTSEGSGTVGMALNWVRKCSISDNRMSNTGAEGFLVAQISAAAIANSVDYLVGNILEKNVSHKTGTHGFSLRHLTGFTLVNNTARDAAMTVPSSCGFIISTAGSGGLLRGNQTKTSATGGSVPGYGIKSTLPGVNVTPDNIVDQATTKKIDVTGAGSLYGQVVYV